MKQTDYLNHSELSMSKLLNRWQYGNGLDLDTEAIYHHVNDYLNQLGLDKNRLLQLSSKEIIDKVRKQNQLNTFLDLVTFLSSIERSMLYTRLRYDILADLNKEENILTCNYY